MTSNIGFAVFFTSIAIVSYISPFISGITISIILLAWLRKKEKKILVNAEEIKRKCIETFKIFIKIISNKDYSLEEKFCLTDYKLAKMPIKILDANLITYSDESSEIKFFLLSIYGEILTNTVFFVKKNSDWTIQEIK